jgi:hypothetical protein
MKTDSDDIVTMTFKVPRELQQGYKMVDAGRIRASQIIISPVKLLPRTWAWMPKMSFRKSRDSPI